ncbi:flagellar filament capping protein FliD [Motilimonas cestriensis]|uniref:Flagellar hook-associated protein 2 n=1 Tax=Motilimonas cestriensis TaxID=2742685 RepID=A0ABS8W9A4_9GAMM|nr:flagellar filament capping protein FliD [Motilimonas cestriensis]MCE2595597.1 flagellar filament capping protein FliD [Motilimonas cestriensis]
MATIAGIGSGLDLESIINTFVQAEKSPKVQRLNQKELDLTAQLSGVGTLKSALSNFQKTLSKISDPESFYQNSASFRYQGSSSDSSSQLGVKTDGVVSGGTFNVEVNALAQGSRLASNLGVGTNVKTDTLGAGFLKFSAGSEEFVVEVEAGDTIENILNKVNDADSNFGVKANIINSDAGPVLVYNSELTGSGNTLNVSEVGALDGTGVGSGNLASLAASLDPALEPADPAAAAAAGYATSAKISVDGQTITSNTNTFENAISGITLNTTELTNGSAISLTVGTDTEAIKEVINEFIAGYNKLQDTMSALSEPKKGVMAFDSSLRQLESTMRSVVGGSVKSLVEAATDTNGDGIKDPTMSMLYDMGITMNESGRLEISSIGLGGQPSGQQRLDDAIKNNLSNLGKVFAGGDGVATKLSSLTGSYLASDGVVKKREQALNDSLKDISDDRIQLDRYIEDYESTLRKKYTALDATVAKYNATGAYLESVLNPPKKDK